MSDPMTTLVQLLQGLVSFLQGLVPFLQIIFTVVLGCLTYQIARQQKETNRNQFRLNFFDKRFAVYEAAMEFIALAALQRPLIVRFLRQGIASLPDSLPDAPSNMSDAGSRSSFQGASPGS